MKVTRIVCDNCGLTLDEEAPEFERITTLSQDWCRDCIKGLTLALSEIPFHDWPKRVTKESVKDVLFAHEKELAALKTELRNVHKANKTAREELKTVRRQAADAYATSNRPQEDLKDIATHANRTV